MLYPIAPRNNAAMLIKTVSTCQNISALRSLTAQGYLKECPGFRGYQQKSALTLRMLAALISSLMEK